MNDFLILFRAATEHLADRVFATVPVLGVEVELIVLWLAAAMLFFTIWLGFVNVRALPLALRVVKGHFHDETAPGEVTQFQALATALSGTVGLGNIAGVAIAIAMGGPGAALWMMLIGLFAMSLKFAEVTLGLKYRIERPDGSVSGGPMWTLKRGFARRGLPRAGAFLGGLYAVFALGGGLMVIQVNQSFSQIRTVTGLDNGLIYGILFALAVAVVVIGGVRWIAQVTSRLVPLMVALYLFGIVAICVTFASEIPAAIALIATSAFDPQAAVGGVIGSFVVGMRRAVYSSEAGIGSAVMAHSAAKTREPVSEGLVALLEPLIDTVIVCSATAIAIVVSGVYAEGYNDIAMTSAAFATVADWFPIILAIAVCLFAYSTVISWGYYGLQAWNFLFGKSRRIDGIFKLLYCLSLPLGAVIQLTTAVNFIDSFFFLMAVPNVIGLYVMAGELRADTQDYLRRMRKVERSPSDVEGQSVSTSLDKG